MTKTGDMSADQLALSIIGSALQHATDSQIVSSARKFDSYYWGRHDITTARKPEDGNRPVNLIAEAVQNRLARVVDRGLVWRYKPRVDSMKMNAKIANLLNEHFLSVFDIASFKRRLAMETMAAGVGHARITPGPSGWPQIDVITSEYIGFDGRATGIDNSRYVVFIGQMDTNEVLHAYGKSVGSHGTDIGQEMGTNSGSTVSAGANKVVFTWSGVNNAFSPRTGYAVDDCVYVAEIWYEDTRSVPIPFDESEVIVEHQQMLEGRVPPPSPAENTKKHMQAHDELLAELLADEDGNAGLIQALRQHIEFTKAIGEQSRRIKYPQGRRMLYTMDGVKLLDEPLDIGMHWRNYVIHNVWEPDRRLYVGKPFLIDAIPVQNDLNWVSNAITQTVKRTLYGIRVAHPSLQKQLKGAGSMMNKTIFASRPDMFKLETGGNIPADFWRQMDARISLLRRVTSTPEVVTGDLPAAGTSGEAIGRLVAESGTQGSGPIDELARNLVKTGKACLDIYQKWLSFEQVLAVVQGEDNVTEQHVRDFFAADMGQLTTVVSQPFVTRERELQLYTELFKMGAADMQKLYDVLDDPDGGEVVARIGELNTAKATIKKLEELVNEYEQALRTQRNRNQGKDGEGNSGTV